MKLLWKRTTWFMHIVQYNLHAFHVSNSGTFNRSVCVNVCAFVLHRYLCCTHTHTHHIISIVLGCVCACQCVCVCTVCSSRCALRARDSRYRTAWSPVWRCFDSKHMSMSTVKHTHSLYHSTSRTRTHTHANKQRICRHLKAVCVWHFVFAPP